MNLNYPLNNDLSFANPNNGTKSVRLDTVHLEAVHDSQVEMVKGSKMSVEKECLEEDSYGISYFRDQIFIPRPSIKQHGSILPESTVTVEDVTHSISPDVPFIPVVIPLVQDGPSDGIFSPGEETETEYIAQGSDR